MQKSAYQSVQNRHFSVVIVTGLSGAGKSTALKVFEDMGFFCVDGLPLSMISRLVFLFKNENPRDYRGLAVGMDIRQSLFLHEWEEVKKNLEQEGVCPQIVFLEAGFDCLITRYAETRRPHPLESKELGLAQALEQEKELLDPFYKQSQLIIDTSEFSIHDLRRTLQERLKFLSDCNHGLRIRVISFGFKYGVPKEADLVFDLRFLPNPYFDETLKKKSGQEKAIQDYVLSNEPGKSFIIKFMDFLTYLFPLYAQEGRYRVTLALGCTGGRHRSVVVAESVFKKLNEKNYQVSLEHRHLELG